MATLTDIQHWYYAQSQYLIMYDHDADVFKVRVKGQGIMQETFTTHMGAMMYLHKMDRHNLDNFKVPNHVCYETIHNLALRHINNLNSEGSMVS